MKADRVDRRQVSCVSTHARTNTQTTHTVFGCIYGVSEQLAKSQEAKHRWRPQDTVTRDITPPYSYTTLNQPLAGTQSARAITGKYAQGIDVVGAPQPRGAVMRTRRKVVPCTTTPHPTPPHDDSEPVYLARVSSWACKAHQLRNSAARQHELGDGRTTRPPAAINARYGI